MTEKESTNQSEHCSSSKAADEQSYVRSAQAMLRFWNQVNKRQVNKQNARAWFNLILEILTYCGRNTTTQFLFQKD